MMRRASVLALFVVLALGAAPAARAETHVFSIAARRRRTSLPRASRTA
jgi:hypothetical protein